MITAPEEFCSAASGGWRGQSDQATRDSPREFGQRLAWEESRRGTSGGPDTRGVSGPPVGFWLRSPLLSGRVVTIDSNSFPSLRAAPIIRLRTEMRKRRIEEHP